MVRVLAVLGPTLAGCGGDSCLTPVAPGEMPIMEVRRNPITWVSDTTFAGFSEADSVSKVRFPQRLLDTATFNDIVVSFEIYDWPEFDVLNAHDKSPSRLLCLQFSELWWGGRFDHSLFGFSHQPLTDFIGADGTLSMKSTENPRAFAWLVRYNSDYQPLLLNKIGRDVHDAVQLAGDSDGVWVSWYADFNTRGCWHGVGPNVDTIVKLDAKGNRLEAVTCDGFVAQDFAVAGGLMWILTPWPRQRVVAMDDGVIVGEYPLDTVSIFHGILFADSTLWMTTYQSPADFRMALVKYDFTIGVPTSYPSPVDTIGMDRSYRSPTWDGRAFVYTAYNYSSEKTVIIRRDQSGRQLDVVTPRLYPNGDVCFAAGSYWMAHHGPWGAGTPGVLLSRICF